MSVAADLADLVRPFSRYLRAANRSERTVTTYAEATSQFTTYITGLDDAPGAVADIDRSHVEGYLVDLAQRGRSPATLNNRYRALRRFFDYLLEEDELADHPMVRMTPPQVPDQPVEVLSEDDLRALLGTCTTKSFEDVRDQAIIRLLADTGMRRGEPLGIDVDDLDLDGAVAFVTGKGQRGRACPFGRKTSLAVDRYLRVRRRLPHAAEEQPLWLTRHGRLNVSGVATMLRRRAERSGIGPVHPHQLRHTFAHQWLSQGGNERDLMRSRLRPYTAATRPAWVRNLRGTLCGRPPPLTPQETWAKVMTIRRPDPAGWHRGRRLSETIAGVPRSSLGLWCWTVRPLGRVEAGGPDATSCDVRGVGTDDGADDRRLRRRRGDPHD